MLSEFLHYLASRRVSIHTSDLSPSERAEVERLAQEGELGLICATGTLAEGINFPVVNVLTLPRIYAIRPEDIQKRKPPSPMPIPHDRLYNMIGRAGRLGLSDYGRGIIVTAYAGDVDGLLKKYLHTDLPSFSSVLNRAPLDETILKSLRNTGTASREDCFDFLLHTLSGQVNLWPSDLRDRVDQIVDRLIEEGFLTEESALLHILPLGSLVVKHGLSVESAKRLGDYVKEELYSFFNPLEIFVLVCLLKETEDVYLSVSRSEIYNHQWSRALSDALEKEGLNVDSYLGRLLHPPESLRPSHHTAFKKALLLRRWIAPETISILEKNYKAYSGMIRRLADNASWLIGCLAELAAAHAKDQECVRRMFVLQEQALYGLPAQGLDWGGLLRKGILNRSEILKLLEFGYQSPSQVREEDRDTLRRFISGEAMEAIYKTRRPETPKDRLSNDYIVEINPARPDEIKVNGHKISLTPLQAGLIDRLARTPEVFVPYEDLLNSIWRESAGDKKQLSKQKNLIKGKINRIVGKKPNDLIETAVGFGMVLRAKVYRT